MANIQTGKRITFKRARPNPLFQDWLEELHVEAKTKKSKLESMLSEALTSLSKYPLPLHTGAECAILKGFNKKLCLFLDQRLEVYNSQVSTNPHPTSNIDSRSGVTETQDSAANGESEKNAPVVNEHKKMCKLPKVYKPSFRSGGYAILIALLEYSKENPTNPFINKENLIEIAQKHSEESFLRPKPETFYTAWSNMSKLITKNLVYKKRSKKVEYCLTEQGQSLAIELLNDSKNIPTANSVIFDKPISPKILVENELLERNIGEVIGKRIESPTVNVRDDFDNIPLENIEFPAGTFEIILLIDKNETTGLSKKNDATVAQFNKYPDLKHEYRSLKVGDFTWIAKHRTNHEELVLPYIVERKRMDDLGASIKDGRFHEQKFRLRKCGLPNVIYLVEKYGSNKHVGLPMQSLMQALANTRVQDNFKVHITDSLTHSARFLAIMTKRLTIEYQSKNLRGTIHIDVKGDELLTFEVFNKSSAKNRTLTVTETFIKLLLQLKGVSVEKALAITNTYSTPRCLIETYEKYDQREGEMLLANLKYNDTAKAVGPSVSKSIYQLFSNKDLI